MNLKTLATTFLPKIVKELPEIGKVIKENPDILINLYKEANNLMNIATYLEACVKANDFNYTKHIEVIKDMSEDAYVLIKDKPEIFLSLINHYKNDNPDISNFCHGLLRQICKKENLCLASQN